MQAIKNKLNSFKDQLHSIANWVSNKYHNNRKKCRGTLITLALLLLLTGLIVGSFKSVDSLSQGVPINYTSGTIIDSYVSNAGSFLGLNTYYYSVPATNYLVTFNSGESRSEKNVFESISARSVQGIKVEIEVDAKVRLVPSNLKSFLEQYGMREVDGRHAGWQIYIKEKIKNVIVQTVAAYKFYQISNQALARNINTQFVAFQTTQNNYPFIVSIIGMNVRYPQNTMQVNDTLGIKLLKETSKLSQLDSQLTLLQNYIGNYSQLIQNYVLMQATNAGTMASREESAKLANSQWVEGVQVMSSSLKNSTLLQKYLQVYFNSLYNVTYRVDNLKPFML